MQLKKKTTNVDVKVFRVVIANRSVWQPVKIGMYLYGYLEYLMNEIEKRSINLTKPTLTISYPP
jgi:hypothetical protein